MSEEVKDAGLIVPRAMVTSFAVNGFMGLVMLITFLFCISSVSDALDHVSGYSFLYVLESSMSLGAVNGITVILLILILACNIDADASASRQVFALARDQGLPFSGWISRVSESSGLCPSLYPAEVSKFLAVHDHPGQQSITPGLMANMKIPGSPEASCSRQRRRAHLWNYRGTLSDQHRLFHGVERDHFSSTFLAHDFLHALNRLCALSTVKTS